MYPQSRAGDACARGEEGGLGAGARGAQDFFFDGRFRVRWPPTL